MPRYEISVYEIINKCMYEIQGVLIYDVINHDIEMKLEIFGQYLLFPQVGKMIFGNRFDSGQNDNIR